MMEKLKAIAKDILRNRTLEKREQYFYKRLPDIDSSSFLDVVIEGDEVNFKHSGHIGDIIYAIPAMRALARGKKINLFMHLNQTGVYSSRMKHPNGSIKLSAKSVELITPLLMSQPQFNSCQAYTGQPIHYDLDLIHQYPLDSKMGSITHWYFWTFGISGNVSDAWLQVKPDNRFNDAIVVLRSQRYRTPGINYRFLDQYPRVVFIGLEHEYLDMKTEVPRLEHVHTSNFLEMAQIIAGSRFFIGNQSFAYSLAEALKVTRVLEIYPVCPHVISGSDNGYGTLYQPQLENIVKHLADQDIKR